MCEVLTELVEEAAESETLPEWVNYTPDDQDSGNSTGCGTEYSLSLLSADGAGLQNVLLTSEEFDFLKRQLALKRGLIEIPTLEQARQECRFIRKQNPGAWPHKEAAYLATTLAPFSLCAYDQAHLAICQLMLAENLGRCTPMEEFLEEFLRSATASPVSIAKLKTLVRETEENFDDAIGHAQKLWQEYPELVTGSPPACESPAEEDPSASVERGLGTRPAPRRK